MGDPFMWFSAGSHDAMPLDLNYTDTSLDFLAIPYDAAWENAAASTETLFQIPRRGSLVLQDARQDEEAGELLTHYRDVVCNYMMPTIDPQRNPWLRLYLPLAMSVRGSQSKLALRHALKAVAAYQLAQSSTTSRAVHLAQAADHKRQAFELVQSILTGGVTAMDTADKYALLASAMTLISTDVFGTDNTDCRVHLDLAKRIVLETGRYEFWSLTPCSKAFIQILQCYDLMASTILSSPNQPPSDSNGVTSPTTTHHSVEELLHTPDTGVASDTVPNSNKMGYDDQYILDLSFGLSRETFALLRDTMELGRQCAKPGHTTTWLQGTLDAARLLKERLSNADAEMGDFPANQLSDLNLPDFDGRGNSSMISGTSIENNSALPPIISQEALENHQKSFHYAVLLYFYRLIYALRAECLQESPRPLKAIAELDEILAEDCQLYVGKIFDCLESVDAVTTDTTARAGNTLWPAFIAAVEATKVELRQRALIWLARAARRGLGNLARWKEVIMETWRRVDRMHETRTRQTPGKGLAPIDWRLIMEERGAYIMLA
jgi:hypothetical protein